jgi:magnesium transporter
MELLETYRDMTTSMVDVYLSSTSNRLNDVMRVLTVISTIFIPLNFVVGIYGMNFGNNVNSPWAMPELQWYYGYPFVWLVIILLAGGLLIAFKRRGWW